MALPIQTIVGGNAPAPKGSLPVNVRVGPTGEIAYTKMHGDYYESTVRGQTYSGSNITAVTTSAGFATTQTGICLTNPIGSNVNLVLRRIKYGQTVAQTAALIFGLQTGFSNATPVTQTTPLVALSNFVGNPTGVGLLASATTLPVAPTRLIFLDTVMTGALTTGVFGGNQYELADSIIIPPGGYVATYTSAASVATSLVFGLVWEEVSTTI